MLMAENNVGEKILAYDCVKQEKESWYCPGCKGEVRLKRGKLIAAHFAHTTLGDCQVFSEGESPEHLAGKQLLFEWLKGSEMEAYLPGLKQRPDVLLGNMAVELQCSSLCFERFIERTKTYLAHNYYPFWILGKKFHPKKHLSRFQKACCYDHPIRGVSSWLMSEKTKELWLCCQIDWHYQHGNRHEKVIFSYETHTLRQVFQTAVPPKVSKHWQISDFKEVLSRKLTQREPGILKIQEKLYLKGNHLSQLPTWCYESSRFFFFFEEELLYYRWLFIEEPTYERWLQAIEETEATWYFPLISKERILHEVYQECLCLVDGIK